MKITYQNNPAIELTPGTITVIATNNRNVYLELLRSMTDYSEIVKFYSDDYERIDLNKAMDWDGDVVADLGLEKTYANEILKSIESSITDEERTKFNQVANELFTLVQDKLLMSGIPLEANFDGDLKRLLKYCQIHFPVSVVEDPYGIIESDLKLHLECDDNSCIGLTNVSHYLNADQISNLVDINTHLKTKVLFIEFTESRNQDAYPNCDYHYVDEDFIVW